MFRKKNDSEIIPLSENFIVWSGGDVGILDERYFSSHINSLSICPLGVGEKFGFGYSYKEGRHASAWLSSYVFVESKFLNEDWIPRGHSYSVNVKSDKDRGRLDLSFMITGLGMQGHTRYGLILRRIEEDLYLCSE